MSSGALNGGQDGMAVHVRHLELTERKIRFSGKGLPMIRSRSFGHRILRTRLAVILISSLAFGAAMARAQSQPPDTVPGPKLSQAERTRQLQERDRLRAQVVKLAQAGKVDEALVTAVKELAATREVRGELHADVISSLQTLAGLHEKRDDWAAAQKALAEVLDIRQRQPDHQDWRIADSRRALADLERRAALDPAGQQRLKEADRLNRLQDALRRQGKYKEGIDPCRKAMEIRGELLGENHSDYASSLNSLASLYRGMGQYAKAEPLYRQGLEIRKRLLGEDHPDYASSLNDLAVLYNDMRDHAKAEPLYRQALEINKRTLGENHPAYATNLNNLASTLWSMGDFAKAEPLYRQALEIRKTTLGENHPAYVSSLNNLAILYKSMGDYAKAETYVRQALEIAKRALGEDHPAYASSLYSLAAQYKVKGEYAKAEPLYRQVLEIRKRTLGENHPDYARTLGDLAELYRAMGNYAQAEPVSRQSVEIKQRALGESHPDYALGLNNLAILYQAMGDYAQAEPLFRRAMEIRKKALGENHPDYAQSLHNLATAYKDIGDYAKAEPLLRHAMEVSRRALGENHPDYANSLNNLAGLYKAMGDYAKAEPLYQNALEIRKRAFGENHPDFARSLNNLAILYQARREYSKAEPLQRQVLQIRKQALGEHHPDYAQSLHNLGLLYRNMGDPTKAEPLMRRALEINKQALGENHPKYASSLTNLAGLYYSQGNLEAAEQAYDQGLTLLSRWTQESFATLGERQRIRLLAAKGATLDFYLSVASVSGIKAEELYGHIPEWKGVVEARQDEDRLTRDQPELKETLGQLAQARSRLAHLAFTAPAAGQRQAWRQQLDALRNEKEALESDLARKSAAFGKVQKTRRLGAAEVAAALPPGTVFVDLLAYHHYSPPKGGRGPFGREGRLVAFVLRRGQAPVFVPLGAYRPIEQTVRIWRQALDARKPQLMQSAALELRRRVWEPLMPHLEGDTTVLVAPDGALAYFPFAALPGRRPGTYLLEDLAIGYAGSARRMVESLVGPSEGKSKKRDAEPGGLLAIGGIDYQAEPGSAAPTDSVPTPSVLVADSQRSAFGALAGTGPEVRRIGQLFSAAFPQRQAIILTGAAPSEDAVKQQLDRKWQYLHLATHGFFESPARVAAVRADLDSDEYSPNGAEESEDSASLALAPLLHSGVALAGAARLTVNAQPDAQGSPPELEDGIMTAEEVQALDLRGTEMVVLSACETGLGTLEYGQGVMGLRGSFQAAGARAVVASLWKVDDAATGVLMEQFYTNLWSKKMPKLEALRQAQLTVLNDPASW